jgi:hypothetical protein
MVKGHIAEFDSHVGQPAALGEKSIGSPDGRRKRLRIFPSANHEIRMICLRGPAILRMRKRRVAPGGPPWTFDHR